MNTTYAFAAAMLTLLGHLSAFAASPPPLSLTVRTDRVSYGQSDILRITVFVVNQSGSAVDIPSMTPANVQRYLSVKVSTAAGVPIFFISREFDPPLSAVSPAFQTIPPGGQVQIDVARNQSGFGFLGYQTKGVASSLQHFTGSFNVSASLTVTQDTVPASPGPNAFIGTVSSTDDARPITLSVVVGDVNGDGVVSCLDTSIVKGAFGKKSAQSGYDIRADLNHDGSVDIRDLAIVTQRLPQGTVCQ